ncbi:hypothetical protein EV363DRAFT_1394336 [Boletus edulis]|nr:hypothetical protein EV363DRAFT_1394336 [Boletus edulis]
MELHETLMYTYNLFASDTHLQIFILVESEPDQPNHYTFSLSMKIGQVERALCTPVTMKLSVDPRKLDFVVFIFPPTTSIPTGCLYHLRTWLRTGGVDHCMFDEQELWFGKDPDLRAIADASFARLLNATQDVSIYSCMVGRAHVSFILRWTHVEHGTYALSLDYEAGGAGRTLYDNYQLRLYCDPQSVSFVIYTIPISSSPPGASHHLRVWLRTPHSLSSELSTPTSDAYLYQRLWKSDDFKIGASLAFESVHQITLATPGPSGPPGWMSESGSGSGFGFGDEVDEPPGFDPMATLMLTAMEGMGTEATMTPTTPTIGRLGLGTALTPNRKVYPFAAPNVNVGATADDR